MSTITLIDAIRRGANSRARRAIEEGANVHQRDSGGCTPMHHAVFNADKEMVELLLANGADVNATDRHGYTPLHQLCMAFEKPQSSVEEVAELLLRNGADLFAREATAGRQVVEEAVFQGRYYLVDVLSRHGAPVKVSTEKIAEIAARIRSSNRLEVTTTQVRAEVEQLLAGQSRMLELGELVRTELEREGIIATTTTTRAKLSPDTPWFSAGIQCSDMEAIQLGIALNWQAPDDKTIGEVYDLLKRHGSTNSDIENLRLKIQAALGEG